MGGEIGGFGTRICKGRGPSWHLSHTATRHFPAILGNPAQKHRPLFPLKGDRGSRGHGKPSAEAGLKPEPQPPVQARVRGLQRGVGRTEVEAQWSSPLPLCLPLPARASGHRPTGQRLQQEGPGTKLGACEPSSKTSTTHSESSHHSNVQVTLQKQNQAPLSLSPSLGKALLHAYLPLRSPRHHRHSADESLGLS